MEGLNPTYAEILEELGNMAPQVVEMAVLRVKNRKLEAALAAAEAPEDGEE